MPASSRAPRLDAAPGARSRKAWRPRVLDRPAIDVSTGASRHPPSACERVPDSKLATPTAAASLRHPLQSQHLRLHALDVDVAVMDQDEAADAAPLVLELDAGTMILVDLPRRTVGVTRDR